MEGFAFRAYIPALNGEVLRANQINFTYALCTNHYAKFNSVKSMVLAVAL
jgi:hypothetical protein